MLEATNSLEANPSPRDDNDDDIGDIIIYICIAAGVLLALCCCIMATGCLVACVTYWKKSRKSSTLITVASYLVISQKECLYSVD